MILFIKEWPLSFGLKTSGRALQMTSRLHISVPEHRNRLWYPMSDVHQLPEHQVSSAGHSLVRKLLPQIVPSPGFDSGLMFSASSPLIVTVMMCVVQFDKPGSIFGKYSTVSPIQPVFPSSSRKAAASELLLSSVRHTGNSRLPPPVGSQPASPEQYIHNEEFFAALGQSPYH